MSKARQKSLVKPFEPSSLCCRPARPERLDPRLSQVIDDACDQWRLRADDDEVDGSLAAECQNRIVITEVERDALRVLCDAGIARRAEELAEKRAGADRPGERVFTSAAAQDQYVHLCCPILGHAANM